jgi:hypothetical protein
MFRRSVALLVGLVGGICVILAGLLSFATSALGSVGQRTGGLLLSGVFGLLLTLILGVIILFTCRQRIFWWPGRRLFNGILLVFLGVLALLFVAPSALLVVGALLTVVAGVLLPVEGAVSGVLGRGHLFRRRWW